MTSRVTEIPAAPTEEVHAYYADRLRRETDCHDVYKSMKANKMDFVLVDVRSDEKYCEAHVPGAIHMLIGKIPAANSRRGTRTRCSLSLCRPALQRHGQSSPPPQRARSQGQGHDRRHDRLG